MNSGAASTLRLLFTWPQRHSTSLALPGFLLLSLALHAMSFYLFQVVYPTIVTLPPSPATLSVLNEAIPAHRELLAWAESEDPALLSGHLQRARPGQAALLPLPYQPSFSKAEPGLVELSSSRKIPPLPSVLPPGAPEAPGAVSPLQAPASAAEAAIPSYPPLQLFGEKDFTTRLPDVLPPFQPPSAISPNAEPLRLLISVHPSGAVDHVFLHKSSGDDSWDRAVVRYVRALRLAPLPGDSLWETVLFQWTKEDL